jgi:putative nucleotidyltransferase with HDIG domain
MLKSRFLLLKDKRVILGLVFALFFTFFLSLREDQRETLKIGAISNRYLVAQVDFSFPDEMETEFIRQQTVRDIGTIIRIDPGVLQEMRSGLEQGLISDPSWREQFPTLTFREMQNGIKGIENGLRSIRLTDERTWKVAHTLDPHVPLYAMAQSGRIPAQAWEDVRKMADCQPGLLHAALAVLEMQPGFFVEDRSTALNIKDQLMREIPLIHTKVEAGTLLVEPGEKITPRHVAMLMAMEHALGKSKNFWAILPLVGSGLLSTLLLALSVIYFRATFPAFLQSFSKVFLLLLVLAFTLISSKVIDELLFAHSSPLLEEGHYFLFVPTASLLVCLLLGSRVAWFASAFLAIALAIVLPVQSDRFLVSNLIAASIAIFSAKKIHKRKEVFFVCGKSYLASGIVIFAFALGEQPMLGKPLLLDLSATFLFMLVSAILIVGLLPLLESGFRVMTDLTLMEYMDPSNTLLRRLTLEAPGTYQHSLVVGTLAEAAAQAINANGLFCRVSSLYHDVGKLSNPHYFAENQLNGLNIHPLLTPRESTAVIMSHIQEGETLATRHRLPASFVDIVKQHHGTMLVKSFYRKELERAGQEIDEEPFRYKGPKPQTKEAAIIMIADCVEAASRSFAGATESAIAQLVEKLVAERAEDGQFDESPLSFEELASIKKAMAATLMAAHHVREKQKSKN